MPHIAALLLAAGRSERMGRAKQLLPLAGRPLIRHCLDTLLAAGLQEIIVVLRPGASEIAQAIRELPVTVVENPDPASDMAGSVRAGLPAVAAEADGVLVCLGDHPLVKTATVQAMMDRFTAEPDRIIIPVCNGKKGHPTLFPRPVIAEILSQPTLREVVSHDPTRPLLLPVADPGIFADIDTPADYRGIGGEG